MQSIPAAVSLYGPALLALAASLGVGWLGRAKPRQAWLRPGLALAALLGWAALEPLARLRQAALSPAVGPGLLILPAAAIVLIEVVRTLRHGRNDRLLSVAAALIAGWWVARVAAPAGEFWRICIVVALLAGAVAWLVRERAGRGLALSLALWGGLAAIAAPASWVVASAVMAACWAGAAALRAPAALPSALVAAMLAGADLARGRLFRGHLDAVDFACLLALAAPVAAGLIEPRLPKRWQRLAPVLAAAAAAALAWAGRRAL